MASATPQIEQESITQIRQLIKSQARFKQRSHDTHNQTHRPQLNQHSSATSAELLPQIDTVLLGDSMFERFKTTGRNTQIGQLKYPQLFNAGVGGDKIENVLYRVDLGLLDLLKLHNPKLVVLQLGTNNLRPKQGLTSQQLDDYYLLLQALLLILPTHTQILVLGLFKRTDIEDQYITQSNLALEELVTKMNMEKIGRQMEQDHCVHWMDLSNTIGWGHLQDHVHFNLNGYRIWDTVLYPKIQNILSVHDSK